MAEKQFSKIRENVEKQKKIIENKFLIAKMTSSKKHWLNISTKNTS